MLRFCALNRVEMASIIIIPSSLSLFDPQIAYYPSLLLSQIPRSKSHLEFLLMNTAAEADA